MFKKSPDELKVLVDKFSQDEGEQENADALEQTKVEGAPKEDDEEDAVNENESKYEESKIKTILYTIILTFSYNR